MGSWLSNRFPFFVLKSIKKGKQAYSPFPFCI